MFWLPDEARHGSTVRTLNGPACDRIALQHTSIDLGAARFQCFPGGEDATCGTGANAFNTFDTFRRRTRKNPRRRAASRVSQLPRTIVEANLVGPPGVEPGTNEL
ncbi:hypothetical protein DIE14_05370 [Burkholderia sp. Bp9017]|nr:hypothetical protein DIE14_05370 [Burkholderia sp. Bp9017]RQZ36434.1 hypothetical protein DIE13_06870 [Burkholderia sp. Bp9016]